VNLVGVRISEGGGSEADLGIGGVEDTVEALEEGKSI
jgi:hypothetical protein